LSTEKYKKQNIEDFKNKVNINQDPRKSVVLSVKDLAYNPTVKAIIAFSNSGSTAKLVSTMRPSVKIITISPNINVSRQTSLYWGVESINSRDAHGWKDMMDISKQIIKRNIKPLCEQNIIPIITSYYGRDKHDNIVRFNDNTSNLTAAYIADTLNISNVHIYNVPINDSIPISYNIIKPLIINKNLCITMKNTMSPNSEGVMYSMK